MISITELPSCGLRYLGGETNYKTAEVYFKDLAGKFFNKDGSKIVNSFGRMLADFTLWIWTHPPQTYKIGGLMVEYIKKHDLGTVTESPRGKNYLHKEHDGSVVYVWVRDNVNFERHCKELLGCPTPTELNVVASSKSTGLGTSTTKM